MTRFPVHENGRQGANSGLRYQLVKPPSPITGHLTR